MKRAPRDWSDLLSPQYRNSVALAGDPLTSNQAIQSVLGARLSLENSPVDRAADRGLQFLAELHKVGNFVPLSTLEDIHRVTYRRVHRYTASGACWHVSQVKNPCRSVWQLRFCNHFSRRGVAGATCNSDELLMAMALVVAVSQPIGLVIGWISSQY